MHTNFDFLKKNKEFSSFAEQAAEAEQSLSISPSTAAILSRRALELAVRWVFVNDDELRLPYRDNLSSLVHEETFRSIIEPGLFPMLKFIIKLGNAAVHTNQKIRREDAVLCLRNLFEFCKWVEYCYAEQYENASYDERILKHESQQTKPQEDLKKLDEALRSKDKKLEEIRRENESLREQMSQLREKNKASRNFQVDADTEADTRKKYIDVDLMEAGWQIGKDCLEKQYGQRPLIFTSNGFETYFTDDWQDCPQRAVSGIFTKEELQLNVDRRKSRKALTGITIRDDITNRPYQKEAVTAVCEAIKNKQRKMLLVQATGSGKTRVSISIVDVLRKHNYIKNILFLADRKALVKQAKGNLRADL